MLIQVRLGGYVFTLNANGVVDVSRGKHTVTYMTEIVVSERDLLMFAKGYACGKEKGWGALI